MRNKFIIILVFATSLIGCRKEIGPTNVHVIDPVRHYMPIIQGDELRMLWKVYNDGPNPLIIDDIQPACSSIYLATEEPNLIPVGDSAIMIFNFRTEKNVNLTAHTIRIYGNILPEGEIDLNFDVQIVRPSLDHSDYEEFFYEKRTEEQDATPKLALISIIPIRKHKTIYYN